MDSRPVNLTSGAICSSAVWMPNGDMLISGGNGNAPSDGSINQVVGMNRWGLCFWACRLVQLLEKKSPVAEKNKSLHCYLKSQSAQVMIILVRSQMDDFLLIFSRLTNRCSHAETIWFLQYWYAHLLIPTHDAIVLRETRLTNHCWCRLQMIIWHYGTCVITLAYKPAQSYLWSSDQFKGLAPDQNHRSSLIFRKQWNQNSVLCEIWTRTAL